MPVEHINPPELIRNPAFTNVVSVTGPVRTVYVGSQNAAFQRAWGDRPNPPLVTLARVAGLAHPQALVEIEATAVVPLPAG